KRYGKIILEDNATGSPQIVPLVGTGTGTGPFVTLEPNYPVFGKQAVGTTSGVQHVLLKNIGNATLTINGLTQSGDFAANSRCPGSVLAGSSCTIDVTFT